MKTRPYIQVVSVLLLSLGCTMPKTASVSKQTFSFDYTPKEATASGSAGMSIGLLKPYYAPTFQSGSSELFAGFKTALGGDIEELILAKGFTLKGPYQNIDEMIFEDKKGIEMLLQIEISPQFASAEGKWTDNLTAGSLLYNVSSYSYEGKASLIGKINLSGIEPLTNEKIWSKSVLIPNIENIPIATSKKWERPLTDAEMLLFDPGVYNAIGKALTEQYQAIMNKMAAHLNVEEFRTMKLQIKELKAKKGY